MSKDTTIKGVLLADDNGLVIMSKINSNKPTQIEKGNINPAIAGACVAACKHGILATGKPPENGYLLLDFAKGY